MAEEYFREKVALITGAGSGIGLALAEKLVETGTRVVINDLDTGILKEATNHLNGKNTGHCSYFSGDAGKLEVIEQMLEYTLDQYGRIDMAIPNAGLTSFGNFFDYREEDFDKTIQLNLKGAFFLTQKAAKIMQEQGDGGRILLMSSVTGIMSYPDLSAYSMTKAALQMMARNLVMALAPYGITINAVAPGATLTERTMEEEADYAGTWSKLTPLGKVAQPADIADSCLFLLSGGAGHITGQTLVVDGGWTVVGRTPGDLK